ncbi:RecX family transcriptional regulator [Candidatus Dojkabacteria bacterium]|nr:RecX family transcriptional regulator [Candidatus Dojkabacteria bacterium]
MKITEISVQKKIPSRFNLYIDSLFVLGVGSSSITLFNLYKGKEITEDELTQVRDHEVFSKFYDRAITYVTGVVKSEKQVKQYLKRVYIKKKKDWFGENFEYDIESTVNKVILKMREYHFLDDFEYARQFISSRERSKPRSKSVLSNELRLKGISNEIIQSVLETVDDNDMIYDVYRKKFGGKGFDVNEDSKVVGFLARKGFSWDQISKLESRLRDDIGE